MKNLNSIRIKGNRPVRGTVELAGDSDSAIILIAYAITYQIKDVYIENIPRSAKVTRFIDIITRLGVKIEWVDSTKIKVNLVEKIEEDITFIDDIEDYRIGMLIIPILLKKNGSCVASSLFKNLNEEYKDIGVEVRKKGNTYRFEVPLHYAPSQKLMDLDVADIYLVASRIIQSSVSENLTVKYDSASNRIDALDSTGITRGETEILNLYNQFEFNIFSFLPVITDGEIVIRNYNLTESLQFLLNLGDLGGSYEIYSSDLKIWKSKFEEKTSYDLRPYRIDVVGYILLGLSLNIKKSVIAEIPSNARIISLIKDLNIMGCKIEFPIQNKDAKWTQIIIKPSVVTTVRMTLTDIETAGVILCAAIVSSGNSTIDGLDLLSESMPYLIDNLSSISLDVSFK